MRSPAHRLRRQSGRYLEPDPRRGLGKVSEPMRIAATSLRSLNRAMNFRRPLPGHRSVQKSGSSACGTAVSFVA
jgi:hypothetical protein